MLLVAGGIGCGLGLLLVGFIGAIVVIVLGWIERSDVYEARCGTSSRTLRWFRISGLRAMFPGGSIDTSGASGRTVKPWSNRGRRR